MKRFIASLILLSLIFNFSLALEEMKVFEVNDLIAQINEYYPYIANQNVPNEYIQELNDNLGEYKELLSTLGNISISSELFSNNTSIYNMTVYISGGNITKINFGLPENYGKDSNLYIKIKLDKVMPIIQPWINYSYKKHNTMETITFAFSSFGKLISMLASGDILIKPVGLLIMKLLQMPKIITLILKISNVSQNLI